MTRNTHVVRPLTALGVALLLYVVLLPGTAIVAQPVRERLPVRELTYVVEPICEGENCRLLVGLTFQGDSSGRSRLLLPLAWSEGVELYRAIRNIRSLSEDVKVEDTKEPHVKTVHHRPNQRVSLTYEVVSQPPGTQLTVAVYHNPVVRSSYFYVIGHALWVYPEMSGTTPLRVTLHWKNIPAGWALINSFGVGETRQKVKTTLNEFRKGTFLAGDYRIKQFVIKKRPVYAVTRGEWRFPDEKINNLVQKVVQAQRDFWNSYDFPYYFVAVLPSDRRNVRGGEGRTNSFSLYLPKNLTTLSPEHDLYLLAHETFHAWNPLRLGAYENDRLYWFGEGFTDYYAFLLLLRAGLMSLDEYVAAHNSWIKAYYTSPVRSFTLDEMVQKRQTDWDAEQLFYKKGYLLANHLDFTIRSKTNGKHSLDDVMRSLLRSSKPGNIELSEKRIADALRPYLQEQGASDIEKYMVRGELVPAENSLGACATVEDIEHHSFDAGFDIEKWTKSRVFSGVVPGSNAHRAGLRDGQKWVSGGMMQDDPTSLVKFTVIDGETQKVVQFYPASTQAIRLPQFKLKQGVSVEERAQCLSQLGVPSAVHKLPREANAQQPPPTLDQTLEKEGCATLETRKVRICKYDYSADGKKVEAFTIRPLSDGKHPGLVLLYGREGARTSFNLAAVFAQQGFVCMAISELGYGKSEGKPDFMGPASIDAFAVGFKKFQREPFVDGEKMGVFGYSRGGMAASLLTLKVGQEVRAAVFGAGVYDFKKAYDETGLDGIRESMRAETGMTEQSVRERSSLLRMEKLQSPVLIIHGENDQNAPTNQALILRDQLTKLNKDFEIIILADHTHGQLKGNFIDPVIDFFSRRLKGVPANLKIG